MSYGSPEWQGWVLPEKESIAQIKAAYDLGINAFDTANVCFIISPGVEWRLMVSMQYYSNGLSEEILGKAIKQHNIPRDEIVILTKVSSTIVFLVSSAEDCLFSSGSRSLLLPRTPSFSARILILRAS
jgi:aryl-alcohol dehydrogenase-like predicted oxidoreductase